MGPIEALYRKLFVHRYDDEGYLFYFTAADFPGLNAEPFAFRSGANELRGFFYRYDGGREDELIVFCHGLGGGHLSYMREIERLCRAGYCVLAWDNTGCFASEGESVRGLSQSLADLDAALTALTERGLRARYRQLTVIGHSWGGFAAGCIGNYRDDIDKTVVISGPVTVRALLTATLKANKVPCAGLLVNRLVKLEQKANPAYADASALTAVDAKKSRYLFAHSDDDAAVPLAAGAGYVRDRTTNPDARFMIVHGKYHNPNYTADAVGYMQRTFGALNAAVKKKTLKTAADKKEFLKDVDWRRMTEQDPAFWNEVLNFIG
ncbi:MAG: alpha/beta hydrolase [Clostridia bacterium]|nr:alpha/beta hydrolase [Clostridia bacterium]